MYCTYSKQHLKVMSMFALIILLCFFQKGQQMSQIYPGYNTFYQAMPQPQPGIYPGIQVHSPRWPSAQAPPTGQSGYMAMPGATHQYGPPAHIHHTIPSHIQIQAAPSARYQGKINNLLPIMILYLLNG